MSLPEDDDALAEALGTSQRLGLLGDRPIDEVIEHARVFVGALQGVRGSVIDLGAGGGTPGLVIAADRPDLRVTLVDRRTKRTDLLSRLVLRLGFDDRVTVVAADVGDLLRHGDVQHDAVVARGFGPPATTLATARRCVRQGGRIVISEPPNPVVRDDARPAPADRWRTEPLSQLVEELSLRRVTSDPRVAVFERT